MTGIPPFMDESPEAVFDNILSGRMEWPENDEALSSEAVGAITSLLKLVTNFFLIYVLLGAEEVTQLVLRLPTEWFMFIFCQFYFGNI